MTGEGRLTYGAHLVGTLVGIWLEHHRPSRGTPDLSGATSQSHHRPVRGITGLSGAPQSLPEAPGHHRPVRNTTGLPWTPVRGNTDLPGTPQACQRHHRPVMGITGLPGAVADPGKGQRGQNLKMPGRNVFWPQGRRIRGVRTGSRPS